jgi:hypothetical protein
VSVGEVSMEGEAKYRVHVVLSLIPTAAATTIGPYAVAMGVGFFIGVYGHVIKSRLLILVGILIVGAVSAYFAFGVAKVGS